MAVAKKQTLTPKMALKKCHEYLKTLEIKAKPSDLIIEEIEYSDDEQFMFLTVSYEIDLGFFPERKYRQFKLRMLDGKVVLMKKPAWTKT